MAVFRKNFWSISRPPERARGKDQLYLLKRTKPENVEISQRQDQFIKQIKKLSTFCCRGTLIKKGFTSTLPHVDESRIISVPNEQSFVMMDLLNIFLQLINAYAGVVECSHLVGWKGWGKTYEKIGKNRYNAFIGSCMIYNCWIYCICILFISHQEPHHKVIQLIF